MRLLSCVLALLCFACVPKFDKTTDCERDNDCFKGEACDQILLICIVLDAGPPSSDGAMDLGSTDGGDMGSGGMGGTGGTGGMGGAGGSGGSGGVGGEPGPDMGVPVAQLCGACDNDESCASLGEGVRCVPFDGGESCLLTCSADSMTDCPAGYGCNGDSGLCEPLDGTCVPCGQRECADGQICLASTGRCTDEAADAGLTADGGSGADAGAMDMGVPQDASSVDASQEAPEAGRRQEDDMPRGGQ